MIVVDSSVWIDFFQNIPTRYVERLRQAIWEGEVLVGDLILSEVLQGFRHHRDFERAVREFAAYDFIDIVGRDVAVSAARNYRKLRSAGVTVRKTIDCLIATRCILDDLPLLYRDRDFDPFVEHLGLVSALDLPGVN